MHVLKYLMWRFFCIFGVYGMRTKHGQSLVDAAMILLVWMTWPGWRPPATTTVFHAMFTWTLLQRPDQRWQQSPAIPPERRGVFDCDCEDPSRAGSAHLPLPTCLWRLAGITSLCPWPGQWPALSAWCFFVRIRAWCFTVSDELAISDHTQKRVMGRV